MPTMAVQYWDPREIYYNTGSYLLSAGGTPEVNGLPGYLNGSAALVSDIFNGTSGVNVVHDNRLYSFGDNDVGDSVATLLIPNDPNDLRSPSIRWILSTSIFWYSTHSIDSTQFVRITGYTQGGAYGKGLTDDANICVAPGFACG